MKTIEYINCVRMGWTFVHDFRSLQRETVNA